MDTVNGMSPSMEDYLECIYVSHLEHGVVRVKDISKHMNVRMPSVNNAITMLKKKELVRQEPYGYIEITEEGKALARKIYNRHVILHKILKDVLKITPEIAERDACSMEHILSDETFDKFSAYFEKDLKK